MKQWFKYPVNGGDMYEYSLPIIDVRVEVRKGTISVLYGTYDVIIYDVWYPQHNTPRTIYFAPGVGMLKQTDSWILHANTGERLLTTIELHKANLN